MTGTQQHCRSCGAPVIWVRSERGNRMPVDVDPVPRGNIILSHRRVGEPPVAVVKGPLEIEQLRVQHDRSPQDGPLVLYVSHFATCPNAAAHRQRGSGSVASNEVAKPERPPSAPADPPSAGAGILPGLGGVS